MNERLRQWLPDLPYWILNGLVVVASFWFARGTRLFLNVDALSYISLANLYANGEFVKPINTHWSPLLSWLLVPVLWFGGDPAYWGKLLIGIGVVPRPRAVTYSGTCQPWLCHGESARRILPTTCVRNWSPARVSRQAA